MTSQALPAWVGTDSPLDANHHSRLLGDATRLCGMAGIPKKALAEHVSPKCLPFEKAWITKVNKHRAEGIAGFITYQTKNVSNRFESLTAWCMRNHIDARVKSLTEFMNDPMSAEAVFIPYFFDRDNPPLAKWDAPKLLDMLVSRGMEGKVTILHIEGDTALKALRGVYGKSFHAYLVDKFYDDAIEVGE